MANDVLAPLEPAAVAAFYGRLADAVDAKKGRLKVSMAATLMRLWLSNRDKSKTLTFDAPDHLKNHKQTQDTLLYHRQVYLTEKRARRGGGENWAGVVPRLQGKPPHPKWDFKRPTSMEYECLVEMPLRYQLTGSDEDRDLLYALHGFQLHTNVTVVGEQANSRVRIRFQAFQAYIWDRYDWDYSEHLTVPNPDFNSKNKDAVEPKSQTVVVYHTNARRLENAGLAAPYRFETNPWTITSTSLLSPAEVDAARKL